MESATSFGTEIVEQVAEREGVDPLNLDVKLYEVIDADALEALTNSTGDRPGSVRIQFSYVGYSITVDGDGVTVDEQVSPPDETSTKGQ